MSYFSAYASEFDGITVTYQAPYISDSGSSIEAFVYLKFKSSDAKFALSMKDFEMFAGSVAAIRLQHAAAQLDSPSDPEAVAS